MFSKSVFLFLVFLSTVSLLQGHMSDDTTAEGTPEEPPYDTTCTSLTSQTIRVSWTSPRLNSTNGVIEGYKVIYGPSDSWYDESIELTKITSSSETILHALEKYTNYTMQVLAYTSSGDGVRSNPLSCQTEQDVPEAPEAVKALVMSDTSILVSWKRPIKSNGILQQYTVYIREAGLADNEKINSDASPKTHKIVPNLKNQNLSFQAKDLDSTLKYEIRVAASTMIGEGEPSKSVVIAPNSRVPAKIASFEEIFTTTYQEDVTLPCLAVGVPQPEIKWKIKGNSVVSNDRIQQQPDGALLLKNVALVDAGEYSCHVENSFGQDSVTHQLIVNSPPRSPHVALTATTTSSVTIKIRSNSEDTESVHGYRISYKPEFGDWENIEVDSQTQSYTLENLFCGTRYQVQVTAHNNIGIGEASEVLNTRTRGGKPEIASDEKLIEESFNSVLLHLDAWSDGGCPMLYFVIEQKEKNSTDWILVSNNIKPAGNCLIIDLEPAVCYDLRITAHNYAGFKSAVYEFATLTATGDKSNCS